MRTVLVALTLLVLTPILGPMVIVAGLFGVTDRAGSIFDWAPRLWARAILRAAGVRLVVHGRERIKGGEPHIFVSNHVSWFDVFTLAALLPRYKFVGKVEVFRIPLFGAAARAAGMIPIERENRKAAFQSYEVATTSVLAHRWLSFRGDPGRELRRAPVRRGPSCWPPPHKSRLFRR